MRHVKPYRPRRGTFTEDNIEREIFHRRVKYFLNISRQAVNFVNKKHVALVKRCQYSYQVALLFNCGARCYAQVYAHFLCDNSREGGFTESRRTVKQHMVERFVPAERRFNVYAQIFLSLFLPYIFIKGFRAQG